MRIVSLVPVLLSGWSGMVRVAFLKPPVRAFSVAVKAGDDRAGRVFGLLPCAPNVPDTRPRVAEHVPVVSVVVQAGSVAAEAVPAKTPANMPATRNVASIPTMALALR